MPRLTTDRIARAPSGAPDKATPFACVEQIKGTQRLTALNLAAVRLGLSVGQTLADARAMFPGLIAIPHDPVQDRRLLKKLSDWCQRYTPLVGLDAPDGLFLDVTGCTHLFGGEDDLLRDLLRRLRGFGFEAKACIAPTPGCAWGLARYRNTTSVAPGLAETLLSPLPLAALRLPRETVSALAETGFRNIGDILARPRAPLTARFGAALLLRLDQALGRDEEAITPRIPQAPYSVEQDFAEPVVREEDVLTVIGQLAARLGNLLETRAEGARTLEALLFRVDGEVKRIVIGTSRPLRDPAQISRLFRDKFTARSSDYDAGFGFDKIHLQARDTGAFESGQSNFAAPDLSLEFAHLVDRLAVRLTPERVLSLHPQESHIPEFSAALRPARRLRQAEPRKKLSTQDSQVPSRPLRLFERAEPIDAVAEIPDGPPVRFRWRGRQHRAARTEGPERIAMEWWRDDKGRALTRDYFRVESAEGARFWLYREGLYERETIQPRWFVHGLFA